MLETFAYDALGNLCRRTSLGWATREYTYVGRAGCGLADAMNSAYGSGGTGAVGPHQVSDLVNGTDHLFHYYDARGNQTLRDAASSDRTALYTADGRLHQVQTGSSKQTRFWYGSDGQRYKSEDNGRKTLYLGSVEIVVEGGVTTTRRTVAGVMLQKVVGSSATNYYLFHNQLGSLARITNASGASVDQLDYMNFGWRRDVDTQHANAPAPALTPRGYTVHEMLDAHALIHMNGRVYDAYQGRFMQPDPVIQAPDNAQSWNAYTYAFNNPHVYTDPTGMMSFGDILKIVVAAVITYVTWGAAAPYMAAWAAGTAGAGALATGMAIVAAGGFAAGVVTTGTLKGGLRGAFGAMLTAGVGLMGFDYAGTIIAQGVSGGIMESLSGGNFGNGFLSAGLTAAFMPQLGKIGNDGARTAVGAIVGGTISEATGGKFANGAVSGAIQAAMAGGGSESDLSAEQHASFAEQSAYNYDTALAFEPPSLPQGLVDGVAGFGDTISFGGTKWYREWRGIGSVDYSSGAYTTGEVAGVGYSLAAGGAGGLKLAGQAGRGMEFSHWIPARMGGARNLLNGNYVSTATHALSDPYRYRFMPRAWKALNPMPSRFIQQMNRLPWIWRGTAVGGAYGGTSAISEAGD